MATGSPTTHAPRAREDAPAPPPAAAGGRRTIACLSSAPANPYLGLLYGHLAELGLDTVHQRSLSLAWLRRERRRVQYLHFHWPEGFARHDRGPSWCRPALSWVKLAAFAGRLGAARALGYRIVWTIHQPRPHESVSRLREALAARLLARAAHLRLAHDAATAKLAVRELGRAAAPVSVVPHGSYIGVYPPGRRRDEVRRALGIPEDAFVFLCFGELRGYKGVEQLLEAFRDASGLRSARLVVAGHPKDGTVRAAVEAAASADPRIVPLLRFVPDEQVAELFGACDAAVVARGDGGTSGSLVLACSLGLPVVAADSRAYAELTEGGRAGWLFRAGDVGSLRRALEDAASDPAEARARGRVAHAAAERLSWPEIAAETATLLRACAGPETRG